MKVAIIGNGYSPTGRGWGEQIDTADYVIRMWDCWWQSFYDYGVRYDAGIISLNPLELQRALHWVKRKEFRIPVDGWYGIARRIIEPEQFHKYLQPLHLLLDRDVLTQRAKELVNETGKLKLTRGCLAICHAIITMKADHVLLVGFDNMHEGLGTPNAPGNDALWPKGEVKATHECDGKRKIHKHDCLAEQLLVSELAKRDGVRLDYAQDCLH